MKKIPAKYQCLPFWSWNDELDPKLLEKQIEWMKENGVGGFFMHARGGLTTRYLGKKWFECVKASGEKAKELGLEAYAYDENGWPSGFAGGKLLKDIDNHDQYLSYSFGPYDPKAYVSYGYSSARLIVVSSGNDCLNIYVHDSGSTADILNKKVVDQFISLTHEKYKENDDYGLKGFFTDEPQYYRWATPFSRVVPDYFRQTYHQDIKGVLGLLFVEKEGYREFRYRYWLALQQLMLNNWAKNLYEYCQKNDYVLTGHYVEETTMGYQIMCCGGVMPFYEYEQMPGIDWLGRWVGNELSPKQLGSVAAQLGKKQTIAEMFACCGWDVTPKELKGIAESLYVNGVNRCCQHLMPYSEHGQRKRDYPAHYSPINPWVSKGFKGFNDYLSSLGELLSTSTEMVNVGLFHPIRSCYFDYKREKVDFGVGALDSEFAKVIDKLSALQIPHHYLDETIMESHARVDGKSLVVGKARYDYVILPHLLTMGKSSEALLRQYCRNGGKILLLDGKPSYLEGQPFDYSYLESNCSIDEIKESQIFSGEENKNIVSSFWKDKEGRLFIYVVDKGVPSSERFALRGYKSFSSFNWVDGSYAQMGLDIHFEENQSYVLYLSKEERPGILKEKPRIHLGQSFKLAKPTKNKMILDMLSYSFDKVTWNGPFFHLGVFDELLKQRYSGPLFLSYEFEIDELPPDCLAYIETGRIKSVEINGVALTKVGVHPYEKGLGIFDILRGLKVGKNKLVLEMDYFQSDDVYYALFGDGVTESLKNCLVYDSNIEAVILEGRFGVKGTYSPGLRDNILLGEGFSIVKQNDNISSLIKDGFPFFNGDIELEQDINIEDPHSVLEIPGRFQMLEVEVNGSKAGRMMFSNLLDLSGYLKKGMNSIKIVLTVSNRNLLGPSHTLAQEDLSVSPDTFLLPSSWNKGKSDLFQDKYSFVKTII